MNKKKIKQLLKRLNKKDLKNDFLKLIKNMGLKDILYLLIIPILLSVVMLLPEFIRNSMKFHIYDVRWWQFFTHSFVHADSIHLLNNLKSYFLFVFIGILLASQINMKKQYYILIGIVTFSFTIIGSLVEYYAYPYLMPNLQISAGASGFISGLLGFIPFFWVLVLSKKIKKTLLDFNLFNILIMYVAFLLIIIYATSYKNLWFILIVFLFGSYSCFKYGPKFRDMAIAMLNEGKKNLLNYFFLFFAPILFLVAPFLLFPLKLIEKNNLIDFFMHYIGLIYGMLVCFVLIKFYIRKAPNSLF